MNMLTVRKLPIYDFQRAGTDTKWRIDTNLVRLVHDAVQCENPGLKIGKRASLELVLLQYLESKGLISNAPQLPKSPSLAELILAEIDSEGAP